MVSERVPVVGEVTQAIAHGVGVFAQNNRAGFFCSINPVNQRPLGLLSVPLWIIDIGARVHGANDVGCVGVRTAAFVLNGAVRICAFDPAVHRIVGGAVATLVAQ